MNAIERHLAVCFAVGLAMAIIFLLGIQLGIRHGRRLERDEALAAPTLVQDGDQDWACMPWTEYERLVGNPGDPRAAHRER